MKEIKGDILEFMGNYDFVCVTTNGFVKANGENVMGAGVAKAFKDVYPSLPKLVGRNIRKFGNIVDFICHLQDGNGDSITSLLTFPTKPATVTINNVLDTKYLVPWRRKYFYRNGVIVPGFFALSTLELVEESLKQLVEYVDSFENVTVLLPRPGCSNGGLDWYKDVKPLCNKYLDNRFTIINL